MKYNAFNEPILQPGDDIGAAFSDRFGTELEDRLVARFIDEDPLFGWCCVIEDEALNEFQVHDFTSREALTNYLNSACVTIEDN